MLHADDVFLEQCDNYQKQTYRNRCLIYGGNGKLLLNVPVKHSHHNRQLYKDVRIDESEQWQRNHAKSIQSAYSTSPFYEFFEDEMNAFFKQSFSFILDLNLACLDLIQSLLDHPLNYNLTQVYEKESIHIDLRYLINSRKEKMMPHEPYTQVFSGRFGFLNNLSILDLIFNEGPQALPYLKRQDTTNLLAQADPG